MQTVTTKAMAKVAAVATGLAMATSMLSLAPIAHAASLTAAQVQSILSLLSSFGAGADTIANVNSALTGAPMTTTTTTTSSGSCSFSKDLTIGSTGADVTCLQDELKAGGYMSANATGYFGALTRAGVVAWQKANGVTPAAGYFGAKSRAAFGGTVSTGGGSTTGGGTTPPPVTAGTGNGLKVMLAADSPNNVALVAGQAIGALAKFTFANPTGADIKVTNIAFKRIGISNDATMANVYLYNGAKRLTDAGGVSSGAFNFNDSTGIFTVPAGQTYTVSVLADIAASTSGQQIGAQLTAVTSTGTLDSSVALPINGATQTVSAATLATVDYGATTLPAENTALSPGNDLTVWTNTVTIGTRAVTLKSFQLQNIGSIAATDVKNLRLYVDGVQVGTASTIDASNVVSWDLSAAPLRLETGGRVMKVVGDVVGGSSLTFKFSLRRASDGQMVDTDLNQPVLATKEGSVAFTARVGGVQTISSGTISVVKANNSPSSNVSLSASSVKWASFEMRAAGEDIKVDNIDVQANTSLDRGLDNGKVFLNGVQVGSTKDLTDATSINFTFGSSFVLKAGTTAIVDIYADAKSSTGATFVSGETAAITLVTGVDNGTGVVSLSNPDVPGSDVTGNTVTISSAAVTMTKYSGYNNTSMIAGTNNALLGAFTLSAGATEGVNMNTITVRLSADEAATVTDLILKDNATGASIGATKATLSTSNGYSVNFTIPASGTKVINIYGNVKSGSNPGTWVASIDGSGTGASTGTSVTFGTSGSTTATVDPLQTITVGSSAITMATGVSPDNQNVIGGSSMVKVGSFNFTAQYSGYTVDKIAVKVLANAATAVSSVTLKYPDSTGVTQTLTQYLTLSSGAAQTHSTSTFTGLTFYIPSGTTKSIDAYVNLSTIQNDGDSGKAVTVALDRATGFNATNSAGTATTSFSGGNLTSSDTSGKGTLYVRKSIPTISAVALDNAALTQGSNVVLARVKVTADAAGDISWAKLALTMTKTTTVVMGATTTFSLWSGGSQVAGSFATTTATSSTSLTQTADAWGETRTGGTLSFYPAAEQSVSAGGSATYELRGTISLPSTAGGYSVNTSIANAQTSASSTATAMQVGNSMQNIASLPSFTWSDKSSVATVHSTATSDWTDDYLIKSLPLSVGSLSVSQ